MSINEKVRRALEDFGLTDYELRAYVSLVEHNAMTASGVSENAGIPYSKIYEVLGNLERKGWIETQRGRPSKYFPKAPAEALETTKLRRESTLRTSEEIVKRELQPLFDKKEVRERPDIWIVRGAFNVLAKIRETFNHCEKELLIATPAIPQEVFQLLYPLLLTLKERGVRIMIMTAKAISPKILTPLKEVGEVKLRPKMFGGGVVADSREVVLMLEEEGREDAGLAIWSDHIGLAKFAKNYFEYLWETA